MLCRCVSLSMLLLLAIVSNVSFGQFDEEGDLIPGLLGTITAGDVTIERIDVTLSHDWGTATPEERLPLEPFTVNWQSQLLLQQESAFQFHAYVQGAVDVEIGGESVLSGASEQPGWISGESVELSFGLLELEVTFRKTQSSAQVHLFWSSDTFPLEPIPPHLLFRDEGRPDLALREQGRQAYAAHRCNRCHRRQHEPVSPAAPSLEHVATSVDLDWLIDKLLNRDPAAAHSRMPSFEFTAKDAQAIAAYLKSVSQPVEIPPLLEIKPGKKEPPDGDRLIRSVGCLVCHTVGGIGHDRAFNGGDLTHIGSKRSVDWLAHWLSDPAKLNQDHRMPVIKLSDAERVAIAQTLASWKAGNALNKAPVSTPTDEEQLLHHGRELVTAARCAACHRIPDQMADLTNVPKLEGSKIDWDRSCVTSNSRENLRPLYRHANVEALRAYLESRPGRLTPLNQWARGRQVLEQRNCLSCHERDLGTGIVPIAGQLQKTDERFRGQSQSLIPPSLTAVGDKLHDEAIAKAVRGEQKSARLPWLDVRMPRFRHTKEDQQALLSLLIGHDRIPDGAPETVASPSPVDGPETDREQTLLTGHALAGAGAFNCVACHKFGDYEPRNVALGTKGCDLLMIGDRIRAEFFHRWTRAPLRVVPGMEMPNFNKPVPGVLNNDVDRQLSALWRAINDERFTTPTNPTQVEQLLIVRPGEPPQIVRDVFTVSPENGGGHVARSFAIGFGNGHSLLFDLDRFAVRGWTLGDFARQRTEGKSWYWDLAGVDVMTGFGDEPGFALQHREKGDLIQPVIEDNRIARLMSYSSNSESVNLLHSAVFELEGAPQKISIEQQFSPASTGSAGETGIERLISATHLPAGYDFVVRQNASEAQFKQATISISEAGPTENTQTIRETFTTLAQRHVALPKPPPVTPANDAIVTTLPGMTGKRLNLPGSVMPTSIAVTDDERLVFTSLKGDVYETDTSVAEGQLTGLVKLEQGLPAPFGVLPVNDGLLVVNKAELLWISQRTDSETRHQRKVWADGWGYSENYHDWVTGPVQDDDGNLYLALGSDYQQQGRAEETTQFRGKVIRIDADRNVTPFAHELRFPQGIAIDGQGRLFVSDQQGVANTFNEVNHIVEGRHYGVKSLYEKDSDVEETLAAVQVPHPWTRSVNGIFFLPEQMTGPLAPFAGHGVGCEYNGKRLIRFSLQEVGGELQGACYDLSRPEWDNEEQTFLGPICGTATTDGTIYVGSIFDSGWLGGPNTGEIVKLTPNRDAVPNGIRELRATPNGFEIEFLKPIDATAALDTSHYVLSGYTRIWEGSYSTPDSGRHTPEITEVDLSLDRRTITLHVSELREANVYELNCSKIAADGEELFPATGHYTMNQIPGRTN
ncbi:MAG: PQQ-dependent sugar dehydrogenase [Planctomycetaceae bacterium]|nr:PQQ-dependent sugar dehydrogenase [Planctomycetaceae bacterium]